MIKNSKERSRKEKKNRWVTNMSRETTIRIHEVILQDSASEDISPASNLL